MMDKKLTAKLSDGTEWEVVNNMPTAEGSENRVVWLKPFKDEPREFWVVRDKQIGAHLFFDSLDEANAHHELNENYRELPFLVREVVE